MYYSGARLEEACYLLRNLLRFRKQLPQREFKALGYVDLDEAVRINIHWNRGRKRCEHLWVPKTLFSSLKPMNIEAKSVSTYVRKHELLLPKFMGKLHYQILEDLIEDVSLRNFMQNRYKELTVGDINYSKLVLRADKAYVEKVLPKLRGILNG